MRLEIKLKQILSGSVNMWVDSVKTPKIKVLYDPDPYNYMQNIIKFWNEIASSNKRHNKDAIKAVAIRLQINDLQQIASKLLENNPELELMIFRSYYSDALSSYVGQKIKTNKDIDVQEQSGISPIFIGNNVEYLFRWE